MIHKKGVGLAPELAIVLALGIIVFFVVGVKIFGEPVKKTGNFVNTFIDDFKSEKCKLTSSEIIDAQRFSEGIDANDVDRDGLRDLTCDNCIGIDCSASNSDCGSANIDTDKDHVMDGCDHTIKRSEPDEELNCRYQLINTRTKDIILRCCTEEFGLLNPYTGDSGKYDSYAIFNYACLDKKRYKGGYDSKEDQYLSLEEKFKKFT
tara:strand:- start:386 stop:1003 length:618 start_codon:yes stop_codon:yes gene_type:complete